MNSDTLAANALKCLKFIENNKIESFVKREFMESNQRRREFNYPIDFKEKLRSIVEYDKYKRI